nr:hypothetical protein [Actinomyces sp. HMT 175]
MSHLPPQNPNNDPHIQGAGHPRNAPTPAPYGRYNPPVGQTSAAGFGSIDPVLMEAQRKRSATRKVSVAGSIIGLITMSIQVIATSSVFAAYILPPLEFTFLALLMAIVAPFVVGLGWIVTFILGLIACIRANSRTPQVQPDGWIEAKMPTSALLAASIVAGLPTFIVCVVWPLMSLSGSALEPLLVVCALVEVLIAVGLVFLLRMSKALDPVVRGSQAPGTQPA